jgi:hypothetical protein
VLNFEAYFLVEAGKMNKNFGADQHLRAIGLDRQ